MIAWGFPNPKEIIQFHNTGTGYISDCDIFKYLYYYFFYYKNKVRIKKNTWLSKPCHQLNSKLPTDNNT